MVLFLSKAKLSAVFNFSYMKLVSRTDCSLENTSNLPEKAKWLLLQYCYFEERIGMRGGADSCIKKKMSSLAVVENTVQF